MEMDFCIVFCDRGFQFSLPPPHPVYITDWTKLSSSDMMKNSIVKLFTFYFVVRARQLASVAQLVRALHRNRRAAGSIPATEPIVAFFSHSRLQTSHYQENTAQDIFPCISIERSRYFKQVKPDILSCV